MKKLWAPWRMEYIQGPREDECIFCVRDLPDEDEERLVLFRAEHCFVMMNRFPYSNGHLLVLPFRHLHNHNELTQEEVWEIHQCMLLCQESLENICFAQGFNVGWNIGVASGAGVADHIHLHIVPRWPGDTNFMPVLADVRVVPQHLEATYGQLAEFFRTSSLES